MIMSQHLDRNHVLLEFDDYRDGVKMPARLALLNVVFWRPFFQFDVRPKVKNFLKIEKMASSDVSAVYTAIYEQLLDEFPNVDNMEFVQAIFDNLDDLEALIVKWMPQYQPTVDNLAFAHIMSDPKVQDLNSFKFNDADGTKIAEAKIKAVSKEFIEMLGNPESFENNPILPLMQANVLKANQLPQLLLTYGGRSDINDTIMHHVIRASSFSGLEDVDDYAVESDRKSVV